MKNQDAGSFQEKMDALREEYRQLLPAKIDEVETALAKLKATGGAKSAVLHLRALVHSLSGSGSTFGYSQLSARAGEAEGLINPLLDDEQPLTHELTGAIEAAVDAMRAVIELRDSNEAFFPEEAAPKTQVRRRSDQLVFWLGKDPDTAQRVGSQLHYYGFRMETFPQLADFHEQTLNQQPDIVIFDMFDEGGEFPNTQAVFDAFKEIDPLIPVIALCPPGDKLSVWLAAIRGGVTSCFNKSASLFELIDRLDALTFPVEEEPYRLFIVDDDELLAKNTATIMARAGMKVRFVNDPLKALQPLAEFDPDLILMDLYMPECSGLELSRIIRQDERFLSVPIVYLTKETELNHKMAALESGADDFILKPVKYRYLYHSLSSRIKRSRLMRSFVTKDALTGLAGHTTFLQKLDTLLPSPDPLVLALVDIDGLGKINEKFGFAEGDKVLKSLSILLRRGFGTLAELARYSGPTFAVTLQKVKLIHAEEMFNKLRENFSAITHHGEQPFTLTFSSGIADAPTFDNATDLIAAAERGLSQAKVLGRNRVVSMNRLLPQQEDLPEPAIVATPIPTTTPLDSGSDVVTLEEGDLDMALEDLPSDSEYTAEAEAASSPNGLKVVAVDDDRQVLDMVSAVLENGGFEVHVAATGDEGFKLAKAQQPDLMIIDLLLFPGIHGFELCKMVKSDAELRKTKIILMTAVYKDYRYRMEGKQVGGDEFIIKPLVAQQLLEKVNALLGVGKK